MSLFEELKRRNVFRVGIAYIVVAWLVLQVADVVLNNIVAPGWVFQVIMLVLAIGLPLALVFAWAFEMTPEGIKKEKDVDRSQSITPQTGKKLNTTILVLMALAIAYLLFDKFSAPKPVSGATVEVAGEMVAEQDMDAEIEIPRQSIAVLPFDSRSDRREDEFFAEGIHDDLLTTIAKIGSLKVISRTSVMEYKETTKKIPQIAAELGVAHVLEGGIQRSGNQVRINVQLIAAQTDEHLWAEIFDRELTAENLFSIQSEITRAIADALQTTLSPEEEDRINTMPTQNLAAFEAYQRGRQLMATRDTAELEEATREFQTAVELDPDFAQAWVGVAQSHFHLSSYGTFDADEADIISRDAIEKALAIDHRLGHAYAVLALHEQRQNKLEKAENLYQKAIALDPNDAIAYMWYASVVGTNFQRAQEQIDLTRRAVELDPRSAIIGANLGAAYQRHGRYSLAERQYRNVIEMHPGFETALRSLANLYWEIGRLDQAVRYFQLASELDPGNPRMLYNLAQIYLHLGEIEKAEEMREKMEELDPGSVESGWLDIDFNLFAGNYEASREALNWTLLKARENNNTLLNFAWVETLIGTPGRAREIFLESNSKWMEPTSWQGLIERFNVDACLFSWLLINTGDPELGQQLLQQTTVYLTEKLPAVIEHADWFWTDVCHLVAGDNEKAYEAIELRLSHGHQSNFRLAVRLPMYEPIRHEQRMLDLLARFDQFIEVQRLLVAKLDEEAEL
jgi:TolB-like protein/predicted Zn-dependent protease